MEQNHYSKSFTLGINNARLVIANYIDIYHSTGQIEGAFEINSCNSSSKSCSAYS